MTSLSWLIPALSLTLAAAGLALLAWSLFWDRARGRKRCPKCWYDMAGAAGLVCPECGRDAKRGRGLVRTRRRWKLAGVAVVLIGGPFAFNAAPRVRSEGVWGLAPTASMLLLAPLPESSAEYVNLRRTGGGVWKALRTRLESSELSALHSRMLLGRCARRYADEVESMIRTRPHWPEGESILLEVHLPEWLTFDGPAMLVVRPLAGGLQEQRQYLLPPSMQQFMGPMRRALVDVGVPAEPFHELPIELEKHLMVNTPAGGRPRANQAARGIGWDAAFELQVHIGGSLEDVLSPVPSEQIASALRAMKNEALMINPQGKIAICTLTWNLHELNQALSDESPVTVALQVELILDGDVVAHGDVVLAPRSMGYDVLQRFTFRERPPSMFQSQVLTPSCESMFDTGARDKQWSLRFTGDPTLALRNFASNYYWDGEVEIPIRRVQYRAGEGGEDLTITERLRSILRFPRRP